MISTEVSSLAAHNTFEFDDLSLPDFVRSRSDFLLLTPPQIFSSRVVSRTPAASATAYVLCARVSRILMIYYMKVLVVYDGRLLRIRNELEGVPLEVRLIHL
jgi:hypothetical protein